MWLLYPDKASSGSYLDSAHANTSDGVKRSATGFPTDYSQGNCAHCHEQHASITGAEPNPNSPAGPDYYLLFMDLWINPSQSNLFCYGCHIGAGSLQSSWSRTLNYACYSYRRGGDTTLTCPASVYESFQFVTNGGASQSNCSSNVGSSHLIPDIRAFMAGKAGFPSTLAYINPCSACHNPHRAKRDYPCSQPGAHSNLTTWNVWGDDASERMNALTPNYWAPLRVGGGYEPDGCITSACQSGSNTPDYYSLCTDCHNTTFTIYSNRLGRNLYQINWTSSAANGEFHGNKTRNDSSMTPEWGDLITPYKVGGVYQLTNYVLNCTDCHEPHGSPNEFLLRKTVNGTNTSTIAGNGQWYYWCQTCHILTTHQFINPTFNCFQGGACHRHNSGSANLF
jgi:hypothetical protein